MAIIRRFVLTLLPRSLLIWRAERLRIKLHLLEDALQRWTALAAAIEGREYTAGYRAHLACEVERLQGERFEALSELHLIEDDLLGEGVTP